MHLAIFTRQIGHYHDARYRSAAAAVDRVTVISTANQGGFAEFLARDTGAYGIVRLFDDRASYDQALADRRLGLAVEAALDEVEPDGIAISGWTNPESIAAIRWGRKRGVPLVMMSETQADDAARSRLRETIKSRIVSLCDSALVGGPSHAAYIEHLGIAAERIHLGYNAVDNAHFAENAQAARTDADAVRAAHGLPKRYILASARFIEKKNLPALVTAFAKAVRGAAGETPDLVILGDGETKPAIIAAATAGGVADRVHLPGFRGYDALPAHYGLAEAFAHVSTVEQWGLVVNEAMASSVPVIVSKPCGVSRTVVADGVSGFVVDPDVDAIATAFAELFSMTPEARIQMGDQASRGISDWGPARFGSGMAAAIDSAIAAPRRGRPPPWDSAILAHMEKTAIESVA